jgi:hypothetical protein
MDDAELAARALLSATRIHKTASHMTSALTLTVQVVAQGRSLYLSYLCSAADRISDPNCGAAYNAAIDDTTFGLVNGCGRTNPSNSVSKPSGQPVCK